MPASTRITTMPAKPSKTHDAAQRKVWKAELKDVNASIRKIERERLGHCRACQAQIKKLEASMRRASVSSVRAFNKASARADVLRGRLGI